MRERQPAEQLRELLALLRGEPRAEPARVEPSSVASKSRKLPRKVLTPEYSTSNATSEWMGSAAQVVPFGARVFVDSRVLI